MGQRVSAPSQPQAGVSDRQTRRQSSLWRRSTIISSHPESTAEQDVSQRPNTRRRPESMSRLSQLLQSSPSNLDQQPTTPPAQLPRSRSTAFFDGHSLFPRRTRTASSNSLWPSRRRNNRSHITNTTYEPHVSDVSENSDVQNDSRNTTVTATDGSTLRPSLSSRGSSIRLPNSISDRLAGLRTGRSTSNHSGRRTRDGPRQAEDHTALLSQLLSVAAAATAATLLDGNEQAISQARGAAVDGDDGSFEGFLRSLESGRLAAALRQGGQDSADGTASGPGSNAPLNFFRMFRFGTPATAAPGRNASTTTATAATMNAESRVAPASTESPPSGTTSTNASNRMVPIIIVGIRAVTPGTNASEGGVPPFLDAISALPAQANTSPQNTSIDGGRGAHNRRASMGGVSRFPSSYDNQRDHRTPDGSRRRSITSDGSNWPRPPPASPASPNHSAINSRGSTPVPGSRRPSHSSTPRRESIIRTTTTTTTTTVETTNEEASLRPRAARQRRVSESDNHRHASRRNGIVEPDTPAGENSRSWIIYVLGGSYPENHPLLTTPSLFTDTPSYEDMMLLSQLLGPAKPPVASQQDVADAGGIFRIELSTDAAKTAGLVASAVEGDARIELVAEQRCLVCLCDFEKGEEARQLNKCNHLFHKECIDEWLTKGRNSCPLCRAEGVHETEKKKKAEPAPVDSAAPTPEIPSSAVIPAI